MEPSSNQPGIPRPGSTAEDPSPQVPGTDDYDLAAEMVSDGFRPSARSSPSLSASHEASSTTQLPGTSSSAAPQPTFASLLPRAQQSSPPLPRPSSISKPPRPHDSLRIQNDGSVEDASGPSHPYHMYPQRTLSSTSERRGQQPAAAVVEQEYSLYNDEAELPTIATEQALPVRFGESSNAYHNRIGTQEAATALGHAEELPPYSRYPEVAMTRKPAPTTAQQDTPSFTTSSGSTSPERHSQEELEMQPQQPRPRPEPHQAQSHHSSSSSINEMSGAGGMGIATRNPEFDSTQETLAASQSRPSTLSSHDLNIAAKDLAEKPTPTKWQLWAKRKVCGVVPYWAICLALISVALMSIIMGAVLGTLLHRHPYKPPRPPSGGPPNLEPVKGFPSESRLPEGRFSPPPTKPQVASPSCIAPGPAQNAWDCNLSYGRSGSGFSLGINFTGTNDNPKYDLFFLDTGRRLAYGAQPPKIDGPVPLTLYKDSINPKKMVWFGKHTYTKTVIAEYGDLAPLIKRGNGSEGKRAYGLNDGQEGWYCSWPDIVFRVSIFPCGNTNGQPKPQLNFSGASPSTPTSSAAEPSATVTRLPPLNKELVFEEVRQQSDSPYVGTCRRFTYDLANNKRNFMPDQIYIKTNPFTPEQTIRWNRQSDSYALHSRNPSASFAECSCEWMT